MVFFNILWRSLPPRGPLSLVLKPYTVNRESKRPKNLSRKPSRAGNPFFEWIHVKASGEEFPCEIRLIRIPPYDQPPVIRVNAIKENGNWKFCVADNGIGIDKQYQEKIFVIFQRLHTFDTYEGTGIGLAHCQKIVDLHGGQIWVDSTAGKGSQFYLTIPC
jgi:hypothetical protein